MRVSILLLALFVTIASGQSSASRSQTSDVNSRGSSYDENTRGSSYRSGTAGSSRGSSYDENTRGSSYRGGTDRDRESERLSANFKAVNVRGELLCGTVPATNVRVKLWAKETDLEPSVLLDQKVTDGQGAFNLEGDTQNKPTDVGFEPVLAIYHNCDYENKDKLRRVLIKIPSSYISPNRFARPYIIGKLNLEPVYPKETHEKKEKVDQAALKRLLMKMFF